MGFNIITKAMNCLLIWHLAFERKIEYAEAAALLPAGVELPDAQAAHDEMRRSFFLAESLEEDDQNSLFALAYTLIETETPSELAGRLSADELGMLCALLGEKPASASPFDAVRDNPKLMADLAGDEKMLRAMLLLRVCREKEFSPSDVMVALGPERQKIFRSDTEKISENYSDVEMTAVLKQLGKLANFRQRFLIHFTDNILENESLEQIVERLALPEVFHMLSHSISKIMNTDNEDDEPEIQAEEKPASRSDVFDGGVHALISWYLVHERLTDSLKASSLLPADVKVPDAQTAHKALQAALKNVETLSEDVQNSIFAIAQTLIETEDASSLMRRLDSNDIAIICALLDEEPAAKVPFDAVRDNPQLAIDIAGHAKALRATLLAHCLGKDFSFNEITDALGSEREAVFRSNAKEIAKAFSVDEMNAVLGQVRKLANFRQCFLIHFTKNILENESLEQIVERLALPEVFHLYSNAINKLLSRD